MPNRTFFLAFLMLLMHSLELDAQDSINGRVYDHGNSRPLAGAHIIDPASGNGVLSDLTGSFRLPKCETIRVTYTGYRATELKAGPEFIHVFLERDEFSLNELVVTAFQSERPLIEIPGALSVLNQTDLERDDGSHIAPVLNQVPGVYMQTSNLSTNRLVIRGIGSRSPYSTSRIRAYWNEIPLTSGDGISELEDIDPGLVGSVEVIKGPASSIYGAGLGGTVLLEPARAEAGVISLSNRTHFGSFGLWKNMASFEAAIDKFNLGVSYQRMHWDGYRENNRYDRQGLTLTGAFYPGSSTVLRLLVSWTDLRSFIPSSIDSTTYWEDPRAAAPGWAEAEGYEAYNKVLAGFSFAHRFSGSWEWRAGVFTNTVNSYEPRPFNILDEFRQWAGVRTRVLYNRTHGIVRVSASAGGEYFHEWFNWQTYEIIDRMEGEQLSDHRERRQYYNVFAQSQLVFGEHWRVDAGLNVNDTRYRLTDRFDAPADGSADRYRAGVVVSPRLALNYLFNRQASLYVHSGHGFSPPSAEEILTPDGSVNRNIRPEQGWNFEVGSRGIFCGSRLEYDVVLYWMLVRDLLVARRTAEDVFVGVNAGKTWNRGLELSLQYRFSPDAAAWRISGFARYDLQLNRFREFIDMDMDYSGNELTGVPRQTIYAGLDGASDLGLYGNIDVHWVDRYPIVDDNSLFTDAYQVWNVKLGFRRTFFDHLSLDMYAGIANLFNEKYASQILINAMAFGSNAPRYYYPGLPRNYYGGLELKWRF